MEGNVQPLMSNKEIRAKARRVYWGSIGLQMQVAVIYAVFIACQMGVQQAVTGQAYRSITTLLITGLLGPVTFCGMSNMALKAWFGQPRSAGDLFAFVRDWHLLPQAIVFCMLYSLLSQLATSIPTLLMGARTMPLMIAGLVITIAGFIVIMRFTPSSELFVLDQDHRPSYALLRSFSLTSKEVWRLFRLVMPSALIFVGAVVAIFFLLALTMMDQPDALNDAIPFVASLPMALMMPYLRILYAGYAVELLRRKGTAADDPQLPMDG